MIAIVVPLPAGVWIRDPGVLVETFCSGYPVDHIRKDHLSFNGLRRANGEIADGSVREGQEAGRILIFIPRKGIRSGGSLKITGNSDCI